MRDLFKAQLSGVERESNLIPSHLTSISLTTTPCPSCAEKPENFNFDKKKLLQKQKLYSANKGRNEVQIGVINEVQAIVGKSL